MSSNWPATVSGCETIGPSPAKMALWAGSVTSVGSSQVTDPSENIVLRLLIELLNVTGMPVMPIVPAAA